MATYTDEEMKYFYKKLYEGIDRDVNGCNIWKGLLTNQKPYISIRVERQRNVDIKHLLWTNVRGTFNVRTHKILSRCNSPRCVNLDHMYIENRNNLVSNDQIWDEILKKTKLGENGCTLWNGRLHEGGYAIASFKGASYKVHRLSYMIHKNNGEEIPYENERGERLVIRHLCNNKRCVNPKHLDIGTQTENMRDMITHGTRLKGEKCKNAKTSDDIVKKIKQLKRSRVDPDYISVKQISKKFKVSTNMIYKIYNNVSWSHIPDKEGIILGQRTEEKNIQCRKRDKENRYRVWTKTDFEDARKKVDANIKKVDRGCELEDPMCHEWQKGRTSNGYGITSYLGKHVRAHILACEIKYERHKLHNEVTRHLCHNKLCCNPNHLKFGTRSENAIDYVKNGSKNSIINEDIVRYIRRSTDSNKVLSKKFGVIRDQINKIRRGKAWAWVV